MNDPTRIPSRWTRWLTRWLQRCKVAVRPWGQRVSAWLPAGHFLAVLNGPVRVGVSLQSEPWHIVLHDSLEPGGGWDDRVELLSEWQHRHWYPTTLPDVWIAKNLTVEEPLDDTVRAAWWSALEALRGLLPLQACHLVLSWPDEALWSTSITLTGPLTADELPVLLEQELASVLPTSVERTAWAVRRPQSPSASLPVWTRWWRGLRDRASASALWESDVTVRCWVMPLTLARQLDAMGRALGFASLAIEPHSVSIERASEALLSRSAAGTESPAWTDMPGRVAAMGAACRPTDEGANLLRTLRPAWVHGWSTMIRDGWPWLLATGVMAGAGCALGGWQVERWQQVREVWEQRLRQLQAMQATQAGRRLALRQALVQRQQQEERAVYNLRFAQVLQGWAATVPEGVRWQHLSLRPHRIELQGHVLDAERMTRWMDKWPQTLPAGGQHQLQWQRSPVGPSGAPVEALLGLSVQLTWGSAGNVRE